MTNKTGNNNGGEARVQPGAGWLLMDAFVFALMFYKAVEYALLRVDGVVGNFYCAAVLFLAFFIVFALRRAYLRMYGGKMVAGLIAEWVVLGGIVALLARLSLVQRKTQSFTWLPLEWHKLLSNHLLLVKISPLFSIAMLAFTVFCLWLLAKRRKWILLPLLAALAALTVYQCLLMSKEGTIIVYFGMYLLPLLFAIGATAAGQTRMAARTIVLAAASLLLLWHYIGWTPVILDRSFLKMKSVTKLYPHAGEGPAFPMAFFRDFQVDPERHYLFTAYGPTSGLIRYDLRTGKIEVHVTHEALVRYIQLDPANRQFFALDWVNSDMLTLSMDTMQIIKRENLFFKNELYIPLFFIYNRGKIYATYSERPGVAEFDVRPAMRLTRSLMFRDIGLTKFRSGVWKAALDPVTGALYAEVGMRDLSDRFAIARVEPRKFSLSGVAELPEGGLELLAIPEKRRIIATGFFSDMMYEFDMDTMKQTRALHGPTSCRNLLYDRARNMLVGTGFLSGELKFIDYATGREIASTHVGNKAASLYLTPQGDELYLGSTWGMFRVNVDEFLKEKSAR